MLSIGEEMYQWAKDLFPICRSLTGDGVRKTLQYIKNILPDLNLREVPSGSEAFDWVVPEEWNINDAFIEDSSGTKIVDFNKCNLHLVGYSEPIDIRISLEQLQNHLYSLPDQPEAIPYVTSYYQRRWGFCLSDRQRKALKPGEYRVKIDSSLKPGHLTYGELILHGETHEEILLSTYICHPSMANNELSGLCVAVALSRWLREIKNRRYTYRILFIPETIGSIVYLSKHLHEMKRNTVAGFVLTCLGDDNAYSYVASRLGNTLADKIAKHVLKHITSNYRQYSFLDRGSDERQYCSPGVDLPVCVICRSKFGQYSEYHTSLDNLSFISSKGLAGGYTAIETCLTILERNRKYRCSVLCEPQLGKRNLYPSLSTRETKSMVSDMMNLLAYSDGNHDLVDIADLIGVPAESLLPIVKQLEQAGLLDGCGTDEGTWDMSQS